MDVSEFSFRFGLLANPGLIADAPYGQRQLHILSPAGLARARSAISAWPGYAPTPLVALPGLARALGIGGLWYKQEDARFGLHSFKPLGGAYAVLRRLMAVIRDKVGGEEPEITDILAGQYADIAAGMTVTAATDGNHGRSVAWGARMFGCRCIIYINESVSAGREKAIAFYGAEVRRNPGSYDDAVRKAFAMADSEGWHVIPDTTDGTIFDAPRDVTQGYAVMAAEAIDQLPGTAPDMILVQAGVGGMAAATCAQYWQQYGADRPVTVTVEPEQCACWYQSLEARKPVAVTGDIDSFMAGLACGEVSALAWDILEPGAHFAMTLEDPAAADCMRLLADPPYGDPPLVGGESGVAGLAGLIAIARDAEARAMTGLTEESRVVVFGTEGATDPVTYEAIVGRAPQEVAA